MHGPITSRVLQELRADGYEVRVTRIQDEFSVHVTHPKHAITPTQHGMIIHRIMEAATRDCHNFANRMGGKRG